MTMNANQANSRSSIHTTGGARGFRVVGREQLIVIVAAGLSVGHWRHRHKAVHGYSGQRFHGCPSFWGPVWIAAVSAAAIQLPALVGLAILLLVERLGVEGADWSRDAGENRQRDQRGYDSFHDWFSMHERDVGDTMSPFIGRAL